MGTVTVTVLGLTLVGMLFGALFGLLRGRDRALLRLALVILSAALALALRGVVVDAVMNVSIEGATLQATLMESFSSDGAGIPEGLRNLIFVLIEIVIGFVSYFVLLFALRFLTWMLFFPFLKLIIRKFENKRVRNILAEKGTENTESVIVDAAASAEPTVKNASGGAEAEPNRKITRKDRKMYVKKHRGIGALVGLLQGVLLAYFLLAPMTCLLTQVDRIASVKIGGEALLEMPEDVGLSEYSESAIGKIYNTTGHWFYNMMATATDADGNAVSLDSTLNSVGVIMEVADIAVSLEDDLKILGDEDAEPEEVISVLNSLGDKLVTVGGSMEELDDGIVNMIKDLATEMSGQDISQEELDEMLEMLTPEFFVQAGNGVKAFAEYEQVKLDGNALSQDQANDIVDKAYDCLTIIEAVEIEVNEADKATFKTAIDSVDGVTDEDKEKLYGFFGIQTAPAP